MTQREFDILNPGDIVYHKSDSKDVWTIVGRSFLNGSTLAISGRFSIGGQYLWIALLGMSEDRCIQTAKDEGYRAAYLRNPDNLVKERSRPF